MTDNTGIKIINGKVIWDIRRPLVITPEAHKILKGRFDKMNVAVFGPSPMLEEMRKIKEMG